jgi:hypothetical protein
MNTQLLTHVRQLFASYDAPPLVIRSYQRQWIRCIRNLGNKWLLATPVQRITE